LSIKNGRPVPGGDRYRYSFERFFASTAHAMADVGKSLDVIAAATKVVQNQVAAGQAV
jgi:hypothetical protein